MSLDYNNSFIKKNMHKGEFGLEIESLRVDKNGFLSHTGHPFNGNPQIDRDFCENQVEVITSVCYSVDDLYAEIHKLHNTVVTKLNSLVSGQEFLWPFSNPPYVKGEYDIPIARFPEELKSKELYRQYLAEKYGRRKMLFSGIHFNFSFPKDLLAEGFRKSKFKSYKDYKNQIYLELAKKLVQYSWLVVYLTAASPVMDGSFLKDNVMGKNIISDYASPRCSKIGYWNDFIPLLNYNSLDEYIASIRNYVNSGKLKYISELYYPVRVKPLGENSLENLEHSGANHIEFRMLDLNPLSPVGIVKEDIEFLHILIIYLMSLEDTTLNNEEQTRAIKNIKRAAEFNDKNIFIQTKQNNLPVREATLKILNDIESFFSNYAHHNISEIIEYQKDKVLYPQKRYAEIIKNKYGNNYVEKGLALTKEYADKI